VPVDDDRLRNALRDAALEPSTDDVFGRVRSKRTRRRTIKRIERGALVAAMFAALVVASIVVLDEPVSEQQVAVPLGPRSAPEVRVVDGTEVRRVSVERVPVVPDEGYLRQPLLVNSAGIVAVAAYDRDGSTYTFPPSRIVRIDPDGNEVDRVDLQGEILSLADGEGARWALTHDKTVLGPQDPEFRVKRIGSGGAVVSNAVPPGEQPAGRIVAGGGGVWVPVRDGVLRFDPASGVFESKIPLTSVTDRREIITNGKATHVPDGIEWKRLDPAGVEASVFARDTGGRIVEFVSGAVDGSDAWWLGHTADERWVVSRSDAFAPLPPFEDVMLPAGFTAIDIVAVNGGAWVVGELDGTSTLLKVATETNALAVTRTVRLSNVRDSSVAFLSDRTLLVTSRGAAFRMNLPE
jgi:hypothetical protein